MSKKEAGGKQTWPLKITGAGEDVPRHLLAFGPGCGGVLMYRANPTTGNAAVVVATGKGKAETAKVWRTDLGLAPSHHPETSMAVDKAVGLMVALKDAIPSSGPVVIKGQWSGKLVCDDGKMHVELARKVVSYGVLQLVSTPDARWNVRFVREKRWFAEGKEATTTRSGLAEAIQAGLGLVLGLVGDACSVRDTRRRGALDAEHAAKHPVKAPKAPKDTTEKFVAKRLVLPTLEAVQVEKPCPTCVDGLVNAAGVLRMEAGRLRGGVQKVNRLDDAPPQLGRAANLIRRAGVLLNSPLCAGKEKAEGLGFVREATAAFGRARRGIADLDKQRTARAAEWATDAAPARELVTIAEKVALAAAKVGRSCGKGQQSLPGVKKKAATPAAKKVAAKVKAGKRKGAPVTSAPAKAVTVPGGAPVKTAKPSKRARGAGSGDASSAGSRKPRGKATGAAADKKINAAVAEGFKSLAAELRAGG